MKKLLSHVLAVLLVVSVLQTAVFAETCEHVWVVNGVCTLCGVDKNITLDEERYEIPSFPQLVTFAEKVSSGETDICAELTADINGDGTVDVLDISALERLFSGKKVKIKE